MTAAAAFYLDVHIKALISRVSERTQHQKGSIRENPVPLLHWNNEGRESRSCTNQIINCLWMSAIKSRNQVDSELMANVIWSRNWICLIHLSVSDIHTASYNSVLNAPSWRFSPVTMDRLRLPSFFKIAVSHFVSK